ncbi:MAG: hypothetical protein IT545_16020, partial [Rhodobacteraceae bacterium]|nr:hypothetical protein [Paracoccaceae bacterium]
MPLFDRLDADGDGKVTGVEVRAARAARVAGLDADGDGFLTADELTAHRLRRVETAIRNR